MYKQKKSINKSTSLAVGLLLISTVVTVPGVYALESNIRGNANLEISNEILDTKVEVKTEIETKEKGRPDEKKENKGNNSKKEEAKESKGRPEVQVFKATVSTKEKLKVELEVEDTDRLKKNSLKEIESRISSFNGLIKRIESLSYQLDDEKTELSAEAKAEVDNLGAMRSKVLSSADISVLKKEAHALVLSGKHYALMVSKVHIIAAADVEITVADKMLALSEKIQVGINKARTEGKDVRELEELLGKMVNSSTEAKLKAQKALTLVADISAEDLGKSRPVLIEAKKLINSGKQSLNISWSYAKKIVVSLKALYPVVEISLTPTTTTTIEPTEVISTTIPTSITIPSITPPVEFTVTPVELM
jgi:hypothetical protein